MNEREELIKKLFKKAAETNETITQRLYVTWNTLSTHTGKNESIKQIKEVINKYNLHGKYKTLNQITFGEKRFKEF